jgi:hypothetical protein
MATKLQPLLDEGAEDDLETHRKVEGDRRLRRNDASPVQDRSGKNEKDCRSVFEHPHLRLLADQRLGVLVSTLIYYISYTACLGKQDLTGGCERCAPSGIPSERACSGKV